MNRQRIYSLILALCIPVVGLFGANRKPVGLMTDLLEHTDRTWLNGYASNLPVWEIDKAIEPLQFATIRSTHPAFSWIVPGTEQATRQIAYRLIVSDNRIDAQAARGTVWDSGEVESKRSVAVRYGGESLKPATTYFWRVKTVTDTEGESEWSDIKAFRTDEELFPYATPAYPLVKSIEFPTLVKRKEDDRFFIDFGKDAFGQPVVRLSSESAAADSVVLHLGEYAEGEQIVRSLGKSTIRYHRYPIVLQKGTHTYRIKIAADKRNTGSAAIRMPGYVGEVVPFRYCEIEGYTGAPDILRETVHYPFDETAATFVSDNDTLNRIWEFCKYAVRATTFAGIYIDGDRERIPYEADALINQLCHYGVDREYSMARRSYEYLLRHPTWPTEWILQALILAWNDYLYTGDDRALAVSYEQLKPRLLLDLREKNGLISTETGLQTSDFLASIRMSRKLMDIVDWPHIKPGIKSEVMGEADGFIFTDYNTVTNAFHYEAIGKMAQIAFVLGKTEEAKRYASEAAVFRKRFIGSFFDPKQGCFLDGLARDTDHASLHANFFPLAFGLIPKGKQASVLDFIRSRGMACSVYGAQFLLDAVYNAADAGYALHLLTKTDDRSWFNMLRAGATISTEAWDNVYKPNQDWNHAWGAAPANIIPRRLMGVEPLEPGFATVRIKPQPASLGKVEARIPTIRGTVEAAIVRHADTFSLRLTIPANMDAEVYLPLSGNWQVICNGEKLKTGRVKGEPFIYAGRISSGSYLFDCRKTSF